MRTRRLVAMDAGPGSLRSWAVALRDALDGSGPALLPSPPGPAAERERLTATLRPDDATAPLESVEVCLVVPTSGSAGAPKGALLTAAALQASAAATHARLGGPGRWVLALPLTHIAGLMVLVRALATGQTPHGVDTVRGFDAREFARATAAARDEATCQGLPLYTSLVPTQLARLLDAPGGATSPLAAYDAILVGAAATPSTLLRRARQAGAHVVTTYGMSETCGGCVYDGRPLDGVHVDLDEGGHVVIAGPTLFAGYRLRPDLTQRALDGRGRLVTADWGELAADGRLRVLGRVDDVIVTGGENVAPDAVEEALAAVPGIADAVVVGVPDPRWGQRVVAVVVARAGHRADLGEVRAALAGRLAPPAVPKDLVQVDALPLLSSGKPDRAAALAIAAGQLAATAAAAAAAVAAAAGLT